MIDEVDDTVQTFVTGYTVDNLTGPQVFINLIKQTFIDEGLLKDSVHGLVTDVGEHLWKVVMHVIEVHANNYGILSNRLDARAEECIDQLTVKTRDVCEMLAEAQQITSTTHGAYMVKLTQFQKSWSQDLKDEGEETVAKALQGAEGQVCEVPAEFLSLVKEAQEEPRKLATIEICASLHIYTGLMIEGFVDTSAKFVKLIMVEKLADQLEAIWREDLGALDELFPTDQALALVLKKEDLSTKIDELSSFKVKLMSLRPAALPAKRRKRTLSANAQRRARNVFTWNFAKDMERKVFKRGNQIWSEKFTLLGVPNLQLILYPKGCRNNKKGYMSLYLYAPEGWQIKYQATYGGVVKTQDLAIYDGDTWRGFDDFAPVDDGTTKIAVELLEAIPPEANA